VSLPLGPQPFWINDFAAQFAAARAHVERVIAAHPGRPLVVYGAGDTGRAVVALLRMLGQPIRAVCDDSKQGDFEGFPIVNERERLPEHSLVILACRRSRAALADLVGWLVQRGHVVLHCSERRGPVLSDFVGRHTGETCFVIGNGPSLNQTPLELLEGRLTMGCNRITLGLERFGLKLDYWTIEDPLVAQDTAEEWSVWQGAQKFIPEDLLWLVPDVETVCPVPFHRMQFEPELPHFGASVGALFWGGTVTYLMLQLAALFGVQRIVLLGVDFSYVRPDHVRELETANRWQSTGPDPNHFDPTYYGAGRKWHDPRVDRMYLAFSAAFRFAKKTGIEIVNATPGTRLDVFPLRDLRDCV
jgi:hypothetical protein